MVKLWGFSWSRKINTSERGKTEGKKSNLHEDKEILSVEKGKIIGKYHGNMLIM